MWQEPAWHEIILEEPEVWGVQALSSEAVLMRVTARTAAAAAVGGASAS